MISNRGDKPGAHSSRLPHGVDNIETPANSNTTKLFQAWVQQAFLDDRVSVLAGLYDLNSEFYATESAAMFVHPTFGMSAELAGTGKNGPSVFPTSSFGIRVKAEPAPGYYLQAITLDGVPGDPSEPKGTYIKFNEGDGALNVIEGGIPLGLGRKCAQQQAGVRGVAIQHAASTTSGCGCRRQPCTKSKPRRVCDAGKSFEVSG